MRKNAQDLSDRKLVAALLKGDEDAIVYFFYEKFSPTFQYHIYNLFPYKVDVQELVNEFFLYLFENDWKRLRTYKPSESALSTWVSVVSYRFFKNFKVRKIEMNGLVTISDKWESFRGEWMQEKDEEIRMDLQGAIERLGSERDRLAARRIFIEDKAPEDIAVEFECSVDYVYTLKHRLAGQLRRFLKL